MYIILILIKKQLFKSTTIKLQTQVLLNFIEVTLPSLLRLFFYKETSIKYSYYIITTFQYTLFI